MSVYIAQKPIIITFYAKYERILCAVGAVVIVVVVVAFFIINVQITRTNNEYGNGVFFSAIHCVAIAVVVIIWLFLGHKTHEFCFH